MFYGAIKRRLGDNKLAAAVVDSAVIYGYWLEKVLDEFGLDKIGVWRGIESFFLR